ncbi:hypothetical protein BS47DRAFT_1343101 [Hydnum rufescens UP504]|uniref:thioredoxin-dependent peroxiredoxin n=1 Tax=Hydnum rufescens UP504 TaxID=1448309 RepID=A0A9P6AYV1_9AGAM|nr:hypothetical protein BS47DRAFT_1343101 [Hydnum rufescens UP504]
MPHELIGKKAPSFSLTSSNDETYTVTPGETGGKPLAIFFFPKAGTPVCTKEACSFRDSLSDNEAYSGSGVTVIGISADTPKKLKPWVEENKLPYPVLSDADRKVRKDLYKTSSGLLGLIDGRYTFFVDAKGIVRGVEDSSLRASAHINFVDKWLETVKSESK